MGPEPPPTPAWSEGWAALRRNPSEAFGSDGGDDAATLPLGGATTTATATGARSSAFEALRTMPMLYTLAPLPARSFCSGHLYWEQQGLEARDCASVHTTFVEGGNPGKLWRLREAGLWLMDPPEHFEPPRHLSLPVTVDKPDDLAAHSSIGARAAAQSEAGHSEATESLSVGRFLRFVPPQPSGPIAPARNESAPSAFDDKYKAGWLVPTAVNLSPR